METRFRSGSCVLVILFCVVGFCGFGSVSCGENRRPKNVQVAVRAKWEGTPILLEAGELLSKERKDIYWEFIDSWLHSQKEDDDSYTAKDCLKKIMKHGHALLSDTLASLFDFSLILRSASPRLVLYRQLAEESLSSFPLLDDSFSNNASGGLAKTNDTNEMKRSDPLLVQRNPKFLVGNAVGWILVRHCSMMSRICYCGFIALLEWQGTRFSNLNYLILIMFILNHFLEVQLLFCMELLELIALRSFIPPWWKLLSRHVTWCYRGSYYAVEAAKQALL